MQVSERLRSCGSLCKKWGETLDYVWCFSLLFFRALVASRLLTVVQTTVKASLFVKSFGLDKNK